MDHANSDFEDGTLTIDLCISALPAHLVLVVTASLPLVYLVVLGGQQSAAKMKYTGCITQTM